MSPTRRKLARALRDAHAHYRNAANDSMPNPEDPDIHERLGELNSVIACAVSTTHPPASHGLSRWGRALIAICGLVCWTASLACSPCARSSNEWNDSVREAMLFSGTGQEVVTGNVDHIVLNLSKTFFDELISANLNLVDPPDATTDIDVLDDEEERLGEATVSVQLRPSTLRVSSDQSIFLHSELTAVVQVDVPGMRATHVVNGTAKTLVELTADEEFPTRTIIAAGGLNATGIYLPDQEMDEQWPGAFREDLRAVVERLVTRSTNTVRRAIDVLEVVPPNASAVGLQAKITGLRQPWDTDRVLIEITTNLRVRPEPFELDDSDVRALDEDFVVYLHPDLPLAWLRLVLASNPSGYAFNDDGLAVDPPAYRAIPAGVGESSEDPSGPLEATFVLYRFGERPCEQITTTVPVDLDGVTWGEDDLAEDRMVSLHAFAQRAFAELLFAGRFSLGTREIIWTPAHEPLEESDAFRFSGPFESRETTMDTERRRDRGGGFRR